MSCSKHICDDFIRPILNGVLASQKECVWFCTQLAGSLNGAITSANPLCVLSLRFIAQMTVALACLLRTHIY